MSYIQSSHKYNNIISIENLLLAWKEFLVGKKQRKDVQEFQRNLMTNIILLHQDLINKTYKHSEYQAFKISDPKPRDIHKAKVRDRLIHHALYRTFYLFFDKTFISDSYSCRKSKGTHKAIKRFRYFSNKVSKNNTKTVWVLKGDIRKFFANIDHDVLKYILQKYIQNKDILWLFYQIIDSFHNSTHISHGVNIQNDNNMRNIGLPLGNLTSQLLVNIYMNEFDQFVKHKLKAKYYIRYADDFVIMSDDKKWLENILPQISNFLKEKLRLTLHPNKVSINTFASSIDFLGWVHFPNHRVIRTVTKRRMWKRIKTKNGKSETVQSYIGLLSHGNTKKVTSLILTKYTSKK